MGQRLSKQDDDEAPKYNGVRVSASLGRKLGLLPEDSRSTSSTSSNIDDSDAKKKSYDKFLESATHRLDADVVRQTKAIIEKNAVLSRALQQSRLVNEMLMAREEEELGKIEEMVGKTLEEENRRHGLSPELDVPCKDCEERVVACYDLHQGDDVYKSCREEVDAYVNCSRNIAKTILDK